MCIEICNKYITFDFNNILNINFNIIKIEINNKCDECSIKKCDIDNYLSKKSKIKSLKDLKLFLQLFGKVFICNNTITVNNCCDIVNLVLKDCENNLLNIYPSIHIIDSLEKCDYDKCYDFINENKCVLKIN